MKEAGREHNRDRLPEESKRICHTIKCHAHYITGRGTLKGSIWLWEVGHLSMGGEQLHCASLAFPIIITITFYYSLSLLLYFYFILNPKTVLTTIYKFDFDFSPQSN